VGAGYPVALSARDIRGISFDWQPAINLSSNSIKTPTFTGTTDTKYTIQITDNNGCVTTDTMQVLVMKSNGLFIPNAFTPNNNGLNDIFKPLLTGANKLNRFSIYNRYGELIFSSKQANDGWDGTYKGELVPSGVYIWMVKYIEISNKPIVEKGTVTLIR
jgi:gliding motility-associated-like protein